MRAALIMELRRSVLGPNEGTLSGRQRRVEELLAGGRSTTPNAHRVTTVGHIDVTVCVASNGCGELDSTRVPEGHRRGVVAARAASSSADWSALYGLAAAAQLLLGRRPGEGIFVGLAAVSGLYCFARPRGGWQVWGWLMLPGSAAALLEIVGVVSRWIGVLFIPVTLLGLWYEHREREALSPSVPRAPTSPG